MLCWATATWAWRNIFLIVICCFHGRLSALAGYLWCLLKTGAYRLADRATNPTLSRAILLTAQFSAHLLFSWSCVRFVNVIIRQLTSLHPNKPCSFLRATVGDNNRKPSKPPCPFHVGRLQSIIIPVANNRIAGGSGVDMVPDPSHSAER